MSTRALCGRAFVNGVLREAATIRIAEGRITAVEMSVAKDAESVGDGILAPGFVDVHVHGGAGADFMDGEPEAVRTVAAFHARQGTTALAATTLSASRQAIDRALRAVAAYRGQPDPQAAQVAGVHLEGPYLHPPKAGAQDRASLRAADPEEVEAWLALAPDLRWMMTAAPEVQGVPELVERLRDRMLFSIGHTSAGYAQAMEAVQKGASHFTHLFNAMPPLHHREPGVVGAAFDSEAATAELIADGHHVHPALLRSVVRLMAGRVALVTDAMRACGMPEGSYTLHQHTVQVADGQARLADGTLAGSVLTMIGAVRNLVQLCGLPLEQVLPLATEVPARILQLDQGKGRLRAGFDADLLVLSPDLRVRRVFVRGVEVERPQ